VPVAVIDVPHVARNAVQENISLMMLVAMADSPMARAASTIRGELIFATWRANLKGTACLETCFGPMKFISDQLI
jgi:hypothetical protein